jgi:hypothetical protein
MSDLRFFGVGAEMHEEVELMRETTTPFDLDAFLAVVKK